MCQPVSGNEELALDAKISQGCCWAEISQEHSAVLAHIDGAGFCTMTWIVQGSQIIWSHKPGRGTMSANDTRFAEFVASGATSDGTWLPTIMGKGDLMYAFCSNSAWTQVAEVLYKFYGIRNHLGSVHQLRCGGSS